MSTETAWTEHDPAEKLLRVLCNPESTSSDVDVAEQQVRDLHPERDRGPNGPAQDQINRIYDLAMQSSQIDQHRADLQAALTDAENALARAEAAIDTLAGPSVYDVEIAEGNTDLMHAAFTAAKLHVAALRHLTRHATGSA